MNGKEKADSAEARADLILGDDLSAKEYARPGTAEGASAMQGRSPQPGPGVSADKSSRKSKPSAGRVVEAGQNTDAVAGQDEDEHPAGVKYPGCRVTHLDTGWRHVAVAGRAWGGAGPKPSSGGRRLG